MFFPTTHHIFRFEDVLLFVFVPPTIYVKKSFVKIWRATSPCSSYMIAVILIGSLTTYRVSWSTRSTRLELGVLIFHALTHQCLFLEVMMAWCVFNAEIEFNFMLHQLLDILQHTNCVTRGTFLHGE